MKKGLNKTATVLGGGVAGISAACALADAGIRVRLVERRSYLGGRASSYLHPGVGEVIDNCQHILFRCCTNLIALYERIGVLEKIHWTRDMTMIEPGGRRSVLGPSWLPAPLHGLPKLLSANAFTRADKLALAKAIGKLMRLVPQHPPESLESWLKRNGQTPGAIERFWRLVIASALNADLEAISVSDAAHVVHEIFLKSAQAGHMGMSTVPLSDLYGAADQYLRSHGCSIHYNSNVESLSWDEEASQWSLNARDGLLSSDFLVLALPFEATAKLLPHMPPAVDANALAQRLNHRQHWPICCVHLWFDREITDLDHAVLLDREIHWMYNKGRIQLWRKLRGSYLELVVSASRSFADLNRNEAIARALRELAEFFPAMATAKLEKAALIKEMRATSCAPPGVAADSGPVSPWPNCVLAGDWTATGWASTMESAARSGHLAAEALCAAIDAPQSFFVPDLKPTGLMRWIGN
ncbi:MAG: hydroxysqualene dehydroxylase HpnE [Terracidiphilus sp.]